MKWTGARLGAYEVLAPLAEGGMGEVYRARDTRLGREVALKVLAERLIVESEFLRRFEAEARAASALNHPNIIVVYDIGQAGSTPFIAMELVEGRSLRQILAAGALPVRKALDVAAQAANGLAAAHAKGIVHRDLKPENLMVTRDGQLKILDFGIAKLERAASATEPTAAVVGPRYDPATGNGGADLDLTSAGVVLGTVAYMAPEQAGGRPVDFRADQFALGAILHEMITGRRAFQRATVEATIDAIQREEPPPVIAPPAHIQAPLRWILRRCLAKDPDERYASTRDLAADLRGIERNLAEHPVFRERPDSRWIGQTAAAILGTALIAALVGSWLGGRSAQRPPPAFHQLTFGRGTIWSARFAPDGEAVIYSAAWNGGPFQAFRKGRESPESVPLALPPVYLLAVSRTGELALLTGMRAVPPGGSTVGMLAQAPVTGGTPRELMAGVEYADWSPDGSELAVVRSLGGKTVLEFPLGRVLYETAGWLSHPRVSPDGASVALLEHAVRMTHRGAVVLVRRNGEKKVLSTGWSSQRGLAWTANGREVWVAASAGSEPRGLYAIDLTGGSRLVLRAPGALVLLDISRRGEVLVARETRRLGVNAYGPGASRERDFSWLDSSLVTDLSADGRTLLLTEFGEAGGALGTSFLRQLDGSPAVKLGPGFAQALSPDGRSVLMLMSPSPAQLRVVPTGPGRPREIPTAPLAECHWADLFDDGRRVLLAGHEPGRGVRLYVHDPDSPAVRVVTPEVTLGSLQGFPVSADGRQVAALDSQRAICLYPIQSGQPVCPAGLEAGMIPLRWSADGRSLYVVRPDEVPARVFRVDLQEGARHLWKVLSPSDPAGVVGFPAIHLTPDGRWYAYSYARFLTELYLIDGI